MKQGRRTHSTLARGKLVARLLAGAWRSAPPLPNVSAQELSGVAKLLLKSGSAGLAWCKIRHSDLQSSGVAHKLHQAYRLHSLQTAIHERSLKQVIPLLRAQGVEPVLVKGWAAARLYPESGMRPYGDIDLCVLPGQYEHARAVLSGHASLGGDVDLHLGFGRFYDREAESIFARTELARLDDLDVRVLCAEDHLRFLCLHLLRHGAVRPLWLCDVAVLLETAPDDFDWDKCLGGLRRRADWVACTIGLAHKLLGARIEGTPIERRAKNLPEWLVSTALEEWSTPFEFPAQVSVYLRNPVRHLSGLLKEMPRHWPNPIEATMTLKGPINKMPRLPFQVGHVFSRTAALLLELTRGYKKAN